MEQVLNQAQKKAVAHREGPARVLAGAGTGKTKVITERFISLTMEKVARPEEILVLTFSRAAAEEMRSRITARLKGNYSRLWIKTFHSFCLDILREAYPVGEGTGIQVLNDRYRQELIWEILSSQDWDFYHNNSLDKLAEDVFNLLSRLKDELVPLTAFEEFAKEQQKYRAGTRLLDLARACRLVQTEMEARSLIDFGDMINRVMLLFQEQEELQETYRSRFKYIMVDEFQDTNRAQFELLRSLSVHRNLYVVGDDDQAIYGFRGATDRFIIEFSKYFPGAVTYKLEKNYRSQKLILEAANHSISNNRREQKELYPGLELPEQKLYLGVAGNENIEAEYIARVIREKVAAGGYRWGDFAVLCRSVKQTARPIRLALERAGIPYRVDGLDEEIHPAVSDTLALLHLALGKEDPEAVVRLAFKDKILEYYRLRHYAAGSGLTLWQVMCSPPGELSEAVSPNLQKLWGKVEKLQEIISQALPEECVYQAALLAGCLHVPEEVTKADKQRLVALRNLLNMAREALQKGMGLEDFIISYTPEPAALEHPPNAVHIMTVHQAKGLEFPVVFVPGLVEGLFPTEAKRDPMAEDRLLRNWLASGREGTGTGPSYLEEERRLFYVAVTRAKQELHLTHALYYQEQPATRSVFLEEIAGRKDLIEECSCSTGEVLSGDETSAARRARLNLIKAINFRGYEHSREALRDVLRLQYLHGRLKPAVPLRVGQPARPFKEGIGLELSVSSLNTYQACPRCYFLEHVLNLGEAGGEALTFGRILHGVLAEMNLYRKAKGELPSLNLLLQWYREQWRDDAYRCRVQARQNYERGEYYLRRYYAYEEDQTREILAVEEWFSVPYVDLKGREHRLRGRYDLVSRDPQTGIIEIIDYKTGKRSGTVNKSNKKNLAKSSPRDPNRSLQLALYHYAYLQSKPETDVVTSFYFLRHEQDKFNAYTPEFNFNGEGVISTGHSEESLKLVHRDVTAVIDGLLENKFSERPDNTFDCQWCPCNFVCEVMDDVIR
ncbi:ATP-dependent helicase [Desulfolucanica intricata]|uniref:ATP-dependent helicase n=1 Tax=Desulfolucanica intricata TaxID=1285191 RepID=UPI000837A170|nr:ATP-dependent DNA helicase [Desulfolucanica intricata]